MQPQSDLSYSQLMEVSIVITMVRSDIPIAGPSELLQVIVTEVVGLAFVHPLHSKVELCCIWERSIFFGHIIVVWIWNHLRYFVGIS